MGLYVYMRIYINLSVSTYTYIDTALYMHETVCRGLTPERQPLRRRRRGQQNVCGGGGDGSDQLLKWSGVVVLWQMNYSCCEPVCERDISRGDGGGGVVVVSASFGYCWPPV